MNQHLPGQKTILTVHGYAGDQHQIRELLPVMEHHELPIVVMSPTDSPIVSMNQHICRHGGKRAYIGQDSLDRQYEHFKIMLDYDADYFFMNDSDSFCLTPELPQYLYDRKDTIFSNQVDDFRIHDPRWGPTFHDPIPAKIAMQPPYFFSRQVVEKVVATCKDIVACPVCPFLDWYFVQIVYHAGLRHESFTRGASCETVTPNGVAVMSECIQKRDAVFIHSVKSGSVMHHLRNLYLMKGRAHHV